VAPSEPVGELAGEPGLGTAGPRPQHGPPPGPRVQGGLGEGPDFGGAGGAGGERREGLAVGQARPELGKHAFARRGACGRQPLGDGLVRDGKARIPPPPARGCAGASGRGSG